MNLDRLGPFHKQLRALGQGAHACMLYENSTDQIRAMVPFVDQGIARGEQCAYIADDRTADEVLSGLEAGGVDVAEAMDRGALTLLTKRDSYLRGGAADPKSMIEFLRQCMDEALRAGFSGFRVTGEMTWALGPEPGTDRLLEYEALLNRFFPGSRALAICQYNVERFPAAIVRDVLRAHPTAVIGEEVYDNIFYEPPEMILGEESAATRVSWMRAKLEDARATERKLFLLGEENRFLAEASAALAESLDLEHTLERVAQLAVPRIADVCLARVDHEDGHVHVALAHRDPDAGHALQPIVDAHGGGGMHPSDRPATDELRATNLISDVGEEPARSRASCPVLADHLEAMRVMSMMTVPLADRTGERMGEVRFLTTRASGRRYTSEYLPFAEEFSRRCGLAVENARLYRQAQDAIATRDEFLSIASHEIRTPLTPLEIQLRMLRGAAGEIAREETRALLEKRIGIIERQSARLTRLVGELLDVSRIVGERVQLDLEKVDLAEVVRGVAAQIEERGGWATPRSELRLALADGLVGRWDRLCLEVAVGNLITNALKYGEGEPVALVARSTGEAAILNVADQGIGISPEDQQRIFGRFERAVSARNYGGLGVGLFIARHFVEALGGTIEVESKPGEGSTFTLRLPWSGPQAGC